MRETPRSLGLYYILVGVIGLVQSSLILLACLAVKLAPETIFLAVVMGVMVLVALANIWVGWNLARLLVERPHIPIRFAWLGLLLGLVSFNIFGVLLGGYILHQLKRLAREADMKSEQRVLH